MQARLPSSKKKSPALAPTSDDTHTIQREPSKGTTAARMHTERDRRPDAAAAGRIPRLKDRPLAGRRGRAALAAALVALWGVAGAAAARANAGDGDPTHGPQPVGSAVPAQPSFNYPLAVDVAANGAVSVADGGHDQVVRVDPGDAGHERRFGTGTPSSALGEFSRPTGIAHDSRGHVFVVDQGNNRIVELSQDGRWIRSFGGPASGAGGLSAPASVAIGEHDDVYVTDTGNYRVVEYGPDGHVIRTFGQRGSGDGEFLFGALCLRTFCHANLGTPAGIAVGGGAVYVVDAYDQRVEKFTQDGQLLAAWDRSNGHPFIWPAAVAVAPSGEVVVVEFGGDKVDVIGADGTPIRSWAYTEPVIDGRPVDDSLAHPEGVAFAPDGRLLVADTGDNRVLVFTLAGAQVGEIGTESRINFFQDLSGVAVTPAGEIVVARTDRKTLDRYDESGRRLATIDTSGSPVLPGSPETLSIAGDGTIYDLSRSPSGRGQIDRFSAGGAPLGLWGRYAPGAHTILDPQRVVVGPGGDLYVSDAGRFCVQRFTPSGVYVSDYGLCAADPPPFPPPPGCGTPPSPPCPVPRPPTRSSDDPIHDPVDVAVDGSGDVFVLDQNDPGPPPQPCPDSKPCGPPPPWPPPGSGSKVIVFGPSGSLLRSWGGAGDGPGQIDTPQALALGPDGNVFVVDQQGLRMQVFTATGTYLRTWQAPQITPAGSRQIWGLAVDASGQVISAVGRSSSSIVITTADGTVIRHWDNAGSDVERLFDPHDAEPLPDGNILVSDSGNSRLLELTPNGEQVRQIGARGEGPGEFIDPAALVPDQHGGLLVADIALGRIQDLTSDGQVRAVWGSTGTADGHFSSGPSGLTVAPDGTIYAVDRSDNRVEHFTADGQFLGWAGGCTGGAECNVALGHSRGFDCTQATCTGLAAGSGPGQFNQPYDAAFDSAGRLLVTEIGNGRVQVMNLENDMQKLWPIPPAQPGQSATPAGIAVDRRNHTYVTDPASDTVLVLDGAGHPLARWGSPGGGRRQFSVPTRVRVTDETVYVTDTGNSRILRFHIFPTNHS